MTTQKSFFEKNGGTYSRVGDVLLPDLFIGAAEQRPIGKFGRMRKHYLKKQRPLLYSELLLSGKLYPHLLEIDEACEDRVELLVLQMAKCEGVTETLKAANQMEWVRQMNSIQNRAEEIVHTSSCTAEGGGTEMQVLEDLYLGDVRPSDRGFKRNSQYAKALDEVVKAGDALTEGLTEKQKELFEDYMTAQREVNVLTDCETFCVAFKLGAKIMLDVLTDSPMKEI